MDLSLDVKREELRPLINEAYIGREVWRQIKESYEVALTDVLVFLPKDSDEVSKAGIDQLDKFMNKKGFTKAVVLFDDQVLSGYAKEILKPDRYMIKDLKQSEMSDLLRYYRMVQFFPNIVVISCEEPYASDGLWRNKKVSVEDYVENTFYA